MVVPRRGRVQVTGGSGQGVGHGRDGFAGAKVRFFELWNYGVCGQAMIIFRLPPVLFSIFS